MQEIIYSPTDFVAVVNQTLEYAYPRVIIEGELANFRISKNRWVYFDLKDENANVSFFGTIYQLPGPLEDGLMVRAVGTPRLHPRFGFSVNLESLVPVGEGALKKASDLLYKKLDKEGLFDPKRKRPLPIAPRKIGLITAAKSAAYSDFVKILNERWGGVEILFADVYVQGDKAPLQLADAVEYFNQSEQPEVLVITRGGGGAEDLAAFDDERVVRAVAASRAPTLVAIGHEVDISLAELAADVRASTPSNAAQILVPDRHHELSLLTQKQQSIQKYLEQEFTRQDQQLKDLRSRVQGSLEQLFSSEIERLINYRRLVSLFDPKAALRRGYAIVVKGQTYIRSVKQVKNKDRLSVRLSDGTIQAEVIKASNNG
jgi:exodeoxyribonuclease VII large subunit